MEASLPKISGDAFQQAEERAAERTARRKANPALMMETQIHDHDTARQQVKTTLPPPPVGAKSSIANEVAAQTHARHTHDWREDIHTGVRPG